MQKEPEKRKPGRPPKVVEEKAPESSEEAMTTEPEKVEAPTPQPAAPESRQLVACLIKGKFDDLKKIRDEMFYRLAGADGSVKISHPVCGCSIKYKRLSDFPNENEICPCKDPFHFLVRFEIV